MQRLAAVVLATACLVPLACGDDGGSTSADERTAAREAIAAFEASATAEGFVPSEDDDDDGGFEFTSEECQELDALLSDDEEDLPGQSAEEESEELTRGASEVARETLQGGITYADADALRDELDAFADDRTAPCIEEGLHNTFASQSSGLELRDVEVSLEELDLGDGAVRLLLSAVIAAPGIELPFSLEFLAVRDGRRGATVMTTALGMEPTVDTQAMLDELLGAPTIG